VVEGGAVGEVPSLQEMLRSLLAEGELPDPDDISLFQTVRNVDHDEDEMPLRMASPPTVKAVVTKEDEAELYAFRAVRKIVDGHRVLLTPNGDFVLNLSEEEESRFLELQARLAKSSGLHTAFVAPKYTSGSGFSLIKGRAVPNGLPSFFPPASGSHPPDPIGKMHREEAIGCINQHVLPSFNLGNFKNNGGRFPEIPALEPWVKFHDGAAGTVNAMAANKNTNMMGNNGQPLAAPWDGTGVDHGNAALGGAPAIGSTPLMTVEEAEGALAAAKKQHEATDKKFRQGLTRLRRQFDLH
jgi:CCR4-NOT transcription complex subunit 4